VEHGDASVMNQADRGGAGISVCLLVYNHRHLLESTVRSILQQTRRDFECVISDDCSTDGSWELTLDLAKTDSRVRAIRTPQNLGMPGNANFAVKQSGRPFIALLHHDDICRSDLLEQWAGVLERHPDVGFVFNAYATDESTTTFRESLPGERVDGPWFRERHLLKRWGCPVRGTAMIRRSAWDAVGGMRKEFSLLADIDLWMRLSRMSAVGYVAEPLLTIRHDRPDEYPATYSEKAWSWTRQRFLYAVHAAAHREGMDTRRLADRLKWMRFRARVSKETLMWLAYAVVRKNHGMLLSSMDGANDLEFRPVTFLRRVLARVAERRGMGVRENTPG
jgi:glycosyltransferase involved in cell wall biosynthesis